MISAIDLWKMTHPDARGAASYGPRASVDSWAASGNPQYRDGFVIERVPHCICCGSQFARVEWPDGWRCERHWNSTPCQVEGCKRTGSREKYSETICAQHWRAGVPPGSEARRVWLRFRRIVKRYGWTVERQARSDRLWAWLKRRCQAAADGSIDQREIDRMFGWDQSSLG